MKKLIAVLIVTGFALAGAKAQNAYYDAKKIDSLLKKDSIAQAYEIYIPYFVNSEGKFDFGKFSGLVDSSFIMQVVNVRVGNEDKITALCDAYTAKPRSCRLPSDTICEKCRTLRQDIKQLTSLNLRLIGVNAEIDSLGRIRNALADSMQLAAPDTAIDLLTGIAARDTAVANAIADAEGRRSAIEQSIQNIKTDKESIGAWFRAPGSTNTLVTASFFDDANVQRRIFPPNKTINEQYLIAQQAEERMQVLSRNETASLTNFRIPTQSELIDALAIYIGRRFKQEVAITLVSALRKSLNRQQLLKDLFPETIKLFNNGDDFEMPRFGKMWNHSISEDFVKLPQNICNSAFVETHAGTEKARLQLDVFRDIVKVSTLIMEKNSLPEIVALSMADSNMIRSADVKKSFGMLNMINSELFDSGNPDQYWISWKMLQQMSSGEYNIFLTLLEGKYAPVFSVDRPSQWINDKLNKKVAFKNYITKTLVVLNGLQKNQNDYLKRLSVDANAAYTGTSFWDYQRNIFTALHNSNFLALKDTGLLNVSLLEKGAEIYKLLEAKQYAAMVHESVGILEAILPAPGNRYNELLVKSWKLEKNKYENIAPGFNNDISNLQDLLARDIAFLKANYINRPGAIKQDSIMLSASCMYYDSLADKYPHLLQLKSKAKLADVIINDVKDVSVHPLAEAKSRFQYITRSAEFFTDVMSAGNSKELASVIEAYSLPANSYKIKRNSRFSIDLNAYVGAYAGMETIKIYDSIARKKVSSTKPVYGISVPLGITFSWGSRRNSFPSASASFVSRKGKVRELTGNSFSINLSIIDITAAVTYRLEKGENVALPKELRWSQILSPGLHMRWGIRNTPLALSTGLQYSPQLRNLDKPVDQQQAWRAYAGLFFDLPMFSVYRR